MGKSVQMLSKCCPNAVQTRSKVPRALSEDVVQRILTFPRDMTARAVAERLDADGVRVSKSTVANVRRQVPDTPPATVTTFTPPAPTTFTPPAPAITPEGARFNGTRIGPSLGQLIYSKLNVHGDRRI